MVYYVYSLELPRWGDFNEYTQYTIMLNKNWKDFLIMPHDLALWLTLISSNYPCLEHTMYFHGSKGVRAFEARLYNLATLSSKGVYKLLLQTTVELQWLEHWWLVYHGCFELVLESLGKKNLWLQIWNNLMWFSFLYWKRYIVCTH